MRAMRDFIGTKKVPASPTVWDCEGFAGAAITREFLKEKDADASKKGPHSGRGAASPSQRTSALRNERGFPTGASPNPPKE
jgi:hypothetical protein